MLDGCLGVSRASQGLSEEDRLEKATRGLLTTAPEFSAASPMPAWQKAAVIAPVVIFALALGFAPKAVITASLVIVSLLFMSVAMLRFGALCSARPSPPAAGDEAHGPDEPLPSPRVTILIPVFGEAGIVSQTVAAMQTIAYPPELLEILFLFEEIDTATLSAFEASNPPRHMRSIVVPRGEPQTKPRALAYAMTSLTGDLVAVYDAEDWPDPHQVSRAVDHMCRHPETGCLQFALNIDNREKTWITRQFALEYTALFDAVLPALEAWRLPIPLGGTSNFIPRAVLERVGGWDAHNVTEDANLGLRLARFGWRVRIDPSTTWEEAPVRWNSWLRQRTRWIKGWMQTYLVHMRDPGRTWRDLGDRGFLGFQVLIASQVLSPLVHPWALALTITSLAKFATENEAPTTVEASLLIAAVLNLLLGYGSGMALAWSTARRRGFRELLPSIILMPAYWLMISVAAHRALGQLIARPFYWEKTPHLGRSRA